MLGTRALVRLIALFSVLLASVPASAARSTAFVVESVRMDGVIGPAMARYVVRALDQAERDNAEALVITIDTPGGLMKSMDDITKALLNRPVPSIGYVFPSGARAASAGVFVMYATTVAAMAPTTHLGAAHPVMLSGGGNIDKTEMAKITNDAAAEIRGFAIRRGRNAAWAERAVRASVSLTSEEALNQHVINLIASSPDDLLAKLDGRHVHTAAGIRILHTRGARLVDVPMDATEAFLQLLSDPNIGFMLMMIAIYGIIFELSNPGSVFPGVIGGLALILALASFAAIEVNVAGLLLIGFAVVLFIADIKVPSHGVLTTGGIVSFLAGSLLLTENQLPFLRISVTLILIATVLTSAFFVFAVGAGLRAQGRTVRTGREAMIGAVGVVAHDLASAGTVLLDGELWSADSDGAPIRAGERVVVERVNGLHLIVRRAETSKEQEVTR